MKTIRLFTLIAILTMSLFQAESAGALPIRDQATLREYALANVASGTRYVWSSSIDYNYSETKTSAEVSGSGAEEVLDSLFEIQMVYRLINPNDTVSSAVYLYDKLGNLLFYGYANYTPGASSDKPKFNIWMQNIPLLDDVESAEVLVLDEDGQTVRHLEQWVNDGQLFFDPYLAGAPNGVLVVRFRNGNTLSYDLWNPDTGRAPTGVLEPSSNYQIEGHHVFSDVSVVKVVELWIRPTVLLELSGRTDVTLDISGVVQDGQTTFERPISVVISDEFGVLFGELSMDASEPVSFNFPAGKWRLRFNWQKFGSPGMLYTGPEYSGQG